MADLLACPGPELLHAVAVGDLPDDGADDLLAHVERCPHCTAALAGVAADDTILNALRSQETVASRADEQQVSVLVAQMRALAPAPVPAATDETLTLARDDSAVPAGESDGLAPAQEPDELGRLGPYRVLRLLGEGGMGKVFLAEDAQLQRSVALKVMKPGLAQNATARQRFLREARSAAAIEHDNIVPIYQVGEDRGVPFLAMPLLKGASLEDHLRRSGALPAETAARIAAQIAAGLAAAHDRGLIHRDIKPANIWIEPTGGGRVKILDFGLARGREGGTEITQSGAILGTPAYMSPEQARGVPLDPRTDLYSVGCVLYRMVTGELPHKGGDTLALLTSLALDQPTPPERLNPSVPPSLSGLILKLLAKNPADRFGSARELADALLALDRPVLVPQALPVPEPAASPSADLDGPTMADPPEVLAAPVEPFRAAVPAGSQRSRPWRWVAALLGLALLVTMVAAGVVYLQTPHGVIRIETDDPTLNFKADGKGNYTLVADGKEIKFTAGEHSLTFKNADGEFETDKFVVRKDKTVVVRIEFQKGKMVVLEDGKEISRPLPPKQNNPNPKDPKNTDSKTPIVPQPGPALDLKSGTWEPDKSVQGLPGLIPFPAKLKGVEKWQVMATAAPGQDGDPVSGAASGPFAPSPDGRLVAVVGRHYVHIHDAESGKLLALVPKGGDAVSWSPDSKWIRTEKPLHVHSGGAARDVLFVAPDGTPGPVPQDRNFRFDHGWNPKQTVWACTPSNPDVIHLIDPGTKKVLEVKTNHKEAGKACWSPDGEWLLVVRVDKTAQLFGRDGKAGAALKGAVDPSAVPAWSPDSKTIAALVSPTEVRFWSKDGAAGAATKAHDMPVKALHWRPDGKVLAAVGETDRVWFWKPDGTAEGSVETKIANHGFAWAGDGSAFFIEQSLFPTGRMRVYREIGPDFEEFTGRAFYLSAVNDKLTRLVIDDLLSAEMVEVAGGRVKKLDWKVPTGPSQIRFSPDGGRLYVSDGSGLSAYDTRDPKKVVRFGGPGPGPVHLLAFSPKGDKLAVGTRVGQITICDATGRPIDAPWQPLRFSDDPAVANVNHSGNFFAMTWHPDGRHLAVTYGAKTLSVAVFDTAEGKRVAFAEDAGSAYPPVFHPEDPDSLILICSDFRSASAVWRWKAQRTVTRDKPVLGVPSLSPDGKLLLCGGPTPAVASLDLKTVTEFKQPELLGGNWPLSFTWLPDGRIIAGTSPLSIRTTDGKEVEKPKIDGAFPTGVNELTLVPALNSVLARQGEECYLLDVKTWKSRKIGKIRGQGIRVSPDCKHLVSGDGSAVLYWKIETGELAQIVQMLPDRQFAVFSPAGEILASSPDALKHLTGLVENKDWLPPVLRPYEKLKQ